MPHKLNATGLPPIDFTNIRMHAGAQHTAFEELCVQIFRSQCASKGEVRRVEGAGGDGGVEAYVVRPDQRKIGLQCKWFRLLGPAQWSQLDKSVGAALERHPELSEYRIAIPLDRTPSQLKIWNDRKQKWTSQAKRRIDFVWLGKSELTDILSREAHRALLLYWFGLPQFNTDWMDGVINLSIQNLDRRYSPKQHVETEAGQLIDIFAWSPTFTDSMKKSLVSVGQSWKKCSESCGGNTIFEEPIRTVAKKLPLALERLLVGDLPAMGQRTVAPGLAEAKAILQTWEQLQSAVEDLSISTKKQALPGAPANTPHNLESFNHFSRDFGRTLRGWRDLLDRASLADKSYAVLLGDAGTGKSHLLAAAVQRARNRAQPALLILGEQFTAADEPWTQALRVMGWDAGAESLLSALNQAGLLAGKPALLCIDAVNESEHRNLWTAHLHNFAAKLVKFPFVRLIISCRSDFTNVTLPGTLASQRDEDWAFVMHHGFGEEIFEAVGTYFDAFGVRSPHFPPLIEEFRNPLFLRLFCEAFEGRTLPPGPLPLELVMTARVEQLSAKLKKDIDCSSEDVHSAVLAVVALIRDNHGHAVDKEAVRGAVNQYSPQKGDSRSLYTHLRSNGILVEVSDGFAVSKPTVKVRFAFERFSDYFMASDLCHGIETQSQLNAEWEAGGRFARLLEQRSYWANRGLLTALAIILPERYRVELADLVTVAELRNYVLADFLGSLTWRSAASFTNRSRELLHESQNLGVNAFLQALLRVATIPGHPYNADFIHAVLLKMSLSDRETCWTIPVSRMASEDGNVPNLILTWAMRVPQRLISDGQALLVARVLCWFTSSNHGGFRKRATLAAIRLLEGRSYVAAQMLQGIAEVNDPYVAEKAYAIACGVAMRESDPSALSALASVVHLQVFSKAEIPPHVLLRDYAQAVLEAAAHRNCLPAGVSQASFRPPFRSKWPRIWSEKAAKRVEQDEGWHKVTFSVRPERMMPYGDFGRYVMEARTHYFSGIRKTKPFPANGDRYEFDGRVARRWVLQRIEQLGWNPARFGEYERSLLWRGRHEDDDFKVERISKKYQWIALFELLGYLSDHYHMRPEWRETSPRIFQGAWQIMARNFDPSQPFVPVVDDEDESEILVDEDQLQYSLVDSYPDPFADPNLCIRRTDWVLTPPADFVPLVFHLNTGKQTPSNWLALDGFWKWREREYDAQKFNLEGQLEMWVHVRSWLIAERDFKAFISFTKDIHFWGHGCHAVSLGDGWLGEYPWGGAFDCARGACDQSDEWVEKSRVRHTRTACQWDERGGLTVPSPQLCDLLRLRWSGRGPNFFDEAGGLTAFQTSPLGVPKSRPLIVERDSLREALHRNSLRIVWGVVGERHCWDFSNSGSPTCVGNAVVEFSGVYTLSEEGVTGGITKHIVKRI